MSGEDNFYPELSPDGRKAAQALIDGFKLKMQKVAEDVLADLYTDVATHIESDSWTNYRNKLLSAMCGYGEASTRYGYDFKSIRQGLLRDFRAEIIADLNQDALEEIERLKKHVDELRDLRRY